MIVMLRWLKDAALVRCLDEEVRDAGTIPPGTVLGEVVAVGPGKRTEAGKWLPLGVKVGDRILFERWSGREVQLGDEEYLAVSEGEVLKIVT